MKDALDICKLFAGVIVGQMKDIILKANRKATGKLVNSITYKVFMEGNKPKNIIFYGNDYGPNNNVVDKGRGPTQSSGGGKKLVVAIEEWLRIKKISIGQGKLRPIVQRGYRGKARHAPSGRGRTTWKTNSQIKGIAYAIARSIHKKGWKEPPTPHGAINYTAPINKNLNDVCEEIKKYYEDLGYSAVKNNLGK